jgi:hypothetical protein
MATRDDPVPALTLELKEILDRYELGTDLDEDEKRLLLGWVMENVVQISPRRDVSFYCDDDGCHPL